MLFFVDESGQDHNEAPYEILSGVAIQEHDLWNIVQAIQNLELEVFGVRLDAVGVEIKGRKLLKKKVFRHASQGPRIEDLEERRRLCQGFLEKGFREVQSGITEPRTFEEFLAYGQAVLDFVCQIFEICAKFRVKIFASIVRTEAATLDTGFLRKDYSYLFERFFYYLEDFSASEMGIVVFDELEKAQCRILINQMEGYFAYPGRGSLRSARIIPEPFFVHSDLTTAIQIADLVAYCINWGVRLKRMDKPTRKELVSFGNFVFDLRYVGKRPSDSGDEIFPVYGITYIEDLRPKGKRERV